MNDELTDIYREFYIMFNKKECTNNKISLYLTGEEISNNNILCSGILNFTLVKKIEEKILLKKNIFKNDTEIAGKELNWIVDSKINITSNNSSESYSIQNTTNVKTIEGSQLTNDDLFLAVFGVPTNNSCSLTTNNNDKIDITRICRMKGFLKSNTIVLASYIFKQDLKVIPSETPIITFNATSFSHPNTVRWIETTDTMDKEFQLRPITNVKGLNKSGEILAEKLNNLGTTDSLNNFIKPNLVVSLCKGKESDFWTGNYSFTWNDPFQFCHIETFNVNYTAETDFEYELPVTDVENYINTKITTAKLKWSFAGSNEEGIDSFTVNFINNFFETSNNDPVIKFKTTSNFNINTLRWEESTDTMDRIFQLRPITDIEGLNLNGNKVANKLNNLKSKPYVLVSLQKGKDSDFWNGNYGWVFDDATQFSNIQVFNVNYLPATNKPFEYEMPLVDVNNIIMEKSSTAKIEWNFVGVGSAGQDTVKTTFVNNNYDTNYDLIQLNNNKRFHLGDEDPIISFEAPSFSNPNSKTWNENTTFMDKIFQLRPITNIKGVNEEGIKLARKLNSMVLKPNIVINLIKGKESELWCGNYSFIFDDATQFCNIEIFNINYTAQTNFEYKLPVTDVNNLINDKITTAFLKWNFSSLGESTIDTFEVRFVKNKYEV